MRKDEEMTTKSDVIQLYGPLNKVLSLAGTTSETLTTSANHIWTQAKVVNSQASKLSSSFISDVYHDILY